MLLLIRWWRRRGIREWAAGGDESDFIAPTRLVWWAKRVEGRGNNGVVQCSGAPSLKMCDDNTNVGDVVHGW
jgi:hypothetical protein